MGNHVHVLLTPSAAASLAAFMHGAAQRYAYYYNQNYQRTGTLWEGRFRSSLVDSSEYLLACCRYIELNPVRAGLVDNPGTYRWSSYGSNAGGQADPLVSAHPGLAAVGKATYAAFIAEGIGQRDLAAIRDAVNGGFPLGSETFKSRLAAITGKQTERRRPGRPKKDDEAEKSAPVPDLFSAGGAS
jgi:putative transposase